MDAEIKKLIHALRNALVMAADTRSHECFFMPRWSELNAFPHGCCDLASNFLAKYLSEHGRESTVIFSIAMRMFISLLKDTLFCRLVNTMLI